MNANTLYQIMSLTLCMTGSADTLWAQQTNLLQETNYWGKEQDFLLRQGEYQFGLIRQALQENPPATGNTTVRKLALSNLDALLHNTLYDSSACLHQFIEDKIKPIAVELQQPASEGLKIYKLYNDGFIVRTPSTTVAFDLYRGKGLIPDTLMQQLIEQSDVLFISHRHDDHADEFVANEFINADKPVICPSDLWPDKPGISHWRAENPLDKQLHLSNGETINITIYPGHQSELPNNIYVVTTPEGFSVAQTGDQYRKEDLEWIKEIRNRSPKLDILLVNCWTLNMDELIAGFAPQLIITGHENEMGHSIDHREPYWLTFRKLQQQQTPYVVMTWGEQYQYPSKP